MFLLGFSFDTYFQRQRMWVIYVKKAQIINTVKCSIIIKEELVLLQNFSDVESEDSVFSELFSVFCEKTKIWVQEVTKPCNH